MRKTSVYLEPELDRALDQLAIQQGISKAEAIRRGLRRAVATLSRPKMTSIGVGEGPGDVAGDVDRNLGESGFGM